MSGNGVQVSCDSQIYLQLLVVQIVSLLSKDRGLDCQKDAESDERVNDDMVMGEPEN